jgi:alkylhydroperoxidase family enzyme
VDAVLRDHEGSAIAEADRALFALVAKATQDATRVTQVDIDATKAAGWSEEAVYDALTVCALFQFFNTWADAMGVSDLPAAMYEMAGKRLAVGGYAGPAHKAEGA